MAPLRDVLDPCGSGSDSATVFTIGDHAVEREQEGGSNTYCGSGRAAQCCVPARQSPWVYAVAFAPTSASRLPMVCIFRRAVFSCSRFSPSNLATSSSPMASAIVMRPS